MGSIRSVTAAAGVSVVVVALLGLPATAWAAPPSVTTDVNSGQVLDAGTVTLGGTAFDDVAVSDVQVALRDGATGQWLQDDSGGSWGPQYRRVSTELVAPGAPATEWSIDLDSLPPGTYGFHLGRYGYLARAKDDQGAATEPANRPWTNFEIQGLGGADHGYLTIQF